MLQMQANFCIKLYTINAVKYKEERAQYSDEIKTPNLSNWDKDQCEGNLTVFAYEL